MKSRKVSLKKLLSAMVIISFIIQTLSATFMNISAAEATLGMSYYSDGAWHSFNNGVATASDISAIKLQTSSSEYYLQYRTQNSGVSGYYSYVMSNVNVNDNNYCAGTTAAGKTIQLLQIGAYTSSGLKITDGIVVMYRVMVNGSWLSWVSNADPDWMLSVKSKYNLTGDLDTRGSYAGISGQNIQAIEIHVYEEDALNTSSGTFSGAESNDGFTYMANNVSSWSQNTQSAMCGIDCIKIQTSTNKKYYLKYQTMNEGEPSFYGEVSSKNSSGYAGTPGKPVQLLRIRVFTEDNVSLRSGIVVMYRTRIGTEWLPWVSNADPEYMISVQSQYGLDGKLDTHGSYAGKPGTNITGVQIRIFEGQIPSTTVSNLTGQEYTPDTLQYMSNSLNNWTSFSKGVAQSDTIGGIKIRTSSSKDYYLGYNVYGQNKGGFYGEVKSTQDTFAGNETSYDPIQKLSIRVYNSSGVSMETGVVVMYRAKVDTGWLPWVSNAAPDWMQSALMKYHLDGTLDTGSGNAGATGKNIIAIEIHIYEETGVTKTTSPTGNYKIIQTPLIYQYDRSSYYPTGCESASTVMALRYAGVNISMSTFVNNYLDKCSDTSNFDPNVCFGGDPAYSGMGCYAPVIMKACNKLLQGKKQTATRVYPNSLSELKTYLDNNIPVIVWATSGMRAWYYGKNIGIGGRWIAPEHCLLLVGYDDYNYIFKDPMVNSYVTYYSKSQCEAAFSALGKQAIIIQKGTTSTTTPTTPTAPTVKPSAPAQEYVKPSPIEESHCADPVDLSTGSHVIDNSLMSLFAGNKLTVSASYNSSQLVEGSMGIGWSFNYEKSLSVSDNEILIYQMPSVYSRYTATANANEYSCATKGKNGYILTKQSDGSYLLDCNRTKTEVYGADGKLISVTDKQGFVTAIGYSNNLITLTDTLTGKHIYIEKNTDGKITRLYDDDSREVTLTYSNDYLSLIKDVSGNYLTYTYNDAGKIETGTDGEGVCYFTNEYDTSGRVTKQYDGVIDPATGKNHFTTFEYGENGAVTVTNRNGNVSTRIFDNNGQLTSYTDENGNTTTYTYDESLNLLTVTDALNHAEISSYNNMNLPVEKTDKNGVKTKMSYDSNGNVISVIYNQKGDLNDDMEIDIRDLVRMKRYLADSTCEVNLSALDINSDSNYNGADLILLRKYLIGCENSYIAHQSYTYNGRNQVVSYTNIKGSQTTYTYDTNGMPLTKITGNRSIFYVYANGLMMAVTDAMNNTTSYTYNSMGQMQTSTDAANSTTTYNYDNKGNLLSIKNALDDSVSYTYDGNGLKTSYTDANGNVTFYGYNGNMKHEIVTMPNTTNITYIYDGEDRLLTTIDQNGAETDTVYDDAGRVIRKSDAEKNTTHYEYDAVGNVIKQTDSNGAVTLNTYDAAGNLLTSTDSLGNVTFNEYNAFSKPVKITNAMGGVTENVYSAAGEILSVTDPMGNKTSYSYDSYGNKLTSTDANGNITRYEYDKNNNLVSVTDSLGNVTANVYDCNNRLVSTTDPEGNTTTFGYDVLGRQTTVTDEKNNTTTKTYDPNGNVLTVIDAKGKVQSTAVYNESNKVFTLTDASGSVTTNDYDNVGNLKAVKDALVNSQFYTYDEIGRMTTATDKDGNVSNVIYDPSGNIASISGTQGGTTNYTYDALGRMETASTTSGGTVTYGYNALNLKESLTNARSQTTSFRYDLAGKITGYTNTEGTASYTYDSNGNVLTSTDQNGTVTREYDALNRVTKYTDINGRTVKYEYDKAGNLAKLTYPDGTAVYYSYDSNNNLLKASWWNQIESGENQLPPDFPSLILPEDWLDDFYGNRTVIYTYDENNNILTVTKPDGSVTTNIYDDAQRIVSSIERKADNTVIVGYEYVYDALGRIESETHLAENVRYNYVYDKLSRVTKRTVTNLSDNSTTEENYTYDKAGNILSSTVNTIESSFVYDENNRLTSYNGQAVTYDADGNMLTADGMNYIYDSANRLTSAGGNSYTYDVENVRVRNLCTDSDTSYTYNTNAKLSQLLWAQKSDGTVTKYVYAIGLVGEETNGTFKTYHYDYRGSTAAITDQSGNVTDTFVYDTYGKLTSRTGTTNTPFMYNGRDGVMTDSNGLFYMRARYYNPELKRFVNADIIVGEISNSVTLNRYAYANGNPVSNIDPFGLSAERGGGNDSSYIDPWLYQDFVKSKAFGKIVDNKDYIIKYSIYYGVDPNVVAGVIFVEQYYNYNWVDTVTDWTAFYGIIDMSVGLGQVRMSTALFLEESGYVKAASAKDGGWNVPLIGFVHGTEAMARYKRLENNENNITYVAAYIKALQDIWVNDFPEIATKPDILGSLYNLGHNKEPHSNPQTNPFGEKVDLIYDLMKVGLK